MARENRVFSFDCPVVREFGSIQPFGDTGCGVSRVMREDCLIVFDLVSEKNRHALF